MSDLLRNNASILVRTTRAMLLPYWGNIQQTDQKSDRPEDAVTELDRSVEKYLREKLITQYPGIGFVGEEFGGDRGDRMWWLCDPIDGTGHFIRGLPFCSVMLALVTKREVLLGIIYDFVNDVM